MAPTLGLASAIASGPLACTADPVVSEGQFGRPMTLASGSGDTLPLPRLAFINEGCPGSAGGCSSVGEDGCQFALIDSLATLTAIREPDSDGPRLSADDCLEVRPAAGLLDEPPSAQAQAEAVARFRFENLPIVRAPRSDEWAWTAGNASQTIEPGGVLGGNLLRNFAVELRSPAGGPSSVTLYGEFPGSEEDLADQGRAFLPLQFPGRLLGRELPDRCDVGAGRCEIDGFDVSTSAAEIPLGASRMVMDACVALPPCTLNYAPDTSGDPFLAGRCGLRQGLGSSTLCADPTDPVVGGRPASLVVATGVAGMVLFSDSATRMFGDLSTLRACPTMISPNTIIDDPDLLACRIVDDQGNDDGVLHVAGWPAAGLDTPLPRLRVRSVALVAGATRSRADGPCERAAQRLAAAERQCDRYTDDGRADIRNASPPYSGQRDDDDGNNHTGDPSHASLAVLGESALTDEGPRVARWITTTVLPADHPLAQAVRRDVVPEALEPDGLLGTALLRDTDTVLDYTDLNPAVRTRCLDPYSGRCQVLPDCGTDRSRACCHGMPPALLDEFIRRLDDDACCGALSAPDLERLQRAGHCRGVLPP